MAIGIAARDFLAADLSTVAISTTVVDGVGFTSLVIPVYDCETVCVQGKVTGGSASNTLTCDFALAASFDGVTFDTEAYATLQVTMNGTTPVLFSAQIPVTGIHSLKLLSITNNESVGGYTADAVNVRLGKTYPLKP